MQSKTVIVSFSSRIGGNCEQILDHIQTHINNRTNVFVYKFSEFDIKPCGKCSYQCFENNTACPYINDMEYSLLSQICNSNEAYFIVPNYCDYPCANFFIFNERSQCYFQNHPTRLEQYLQVKKKFIVVSNSEAETFINAFRQHTDQEPNVLFLSARKYGCNSVDGDLLTADAAKDALAAYIGCH